MLTTQSLLVTMRATGTINEYAAHHKELSLTEAYRSSSSTFEPASVLDTLLNKPLNELSNILKPQVKAND